MKVHFIGIGGRAMGAIAIALAHAGHVVTGSDEDVYEPMRGCLAAADIPVVPYAPGVVPDDVDVIVAGRRIRSDNPQLQDARARGLPVQSFPAFLRSRFLDRTRNAVVAGGVGKTTTTAMLAWILEREGLRPDYLIGGIARGFSAPARLDGAGLTVLEGDEYASGIDDASPKFLHYAPELVLVTNVLDDHPDLYPDGQGLLEAFATLVGQLPAHGCLVLPSDDALAIRLAAHARCAVIGTGLHAGAGQRITDVRLSAGGSAFSVARVPFFVPMHGMMNVRNAAMAGVAARHFGVPLARTADALAAFEGLADRQEARPVGGGTLVTDKASHPCSIAGLCEALRQRYPGRRLVSVMQPRATGGRRWIYQRDLPAALAGFDRVILTNPYEHRPSTRTPWHEEPFSLDALAEALCSRGVDVQIVPALADLPAVVRDETQPGDVVLLSLREQFADLAAAIEDALASRVTT